MLLSILSVSCFRMYVGLNDWMANLFSRVCLLTSKDTHCLWSVQSVNIQKILCRWQGQKEDMLNVPLLNLSYCELSIRVKTFLLSLYLWLSSASHTAGRSKHICVCVCWVHEESVFSGMRLYFSRLVPRGDAERRFDEICDVLCSVKIHSVRPAPRHSGRLHNRLYWILSGCLLCCRWASHTAGSTGFY